MSDMSQPEDLSIERTTELAALIRKTVPKADADLSVRCAFQAIRIVVNEEYSALEAFLRVLPNCLKPGGRAAILTFQSGEDRRVKKSFEDGHLAGTYSAISEEVIRPSPEEIRSNPRAAPAKLRWALRAPG